MSLIDRVDPELRAGLEPYFCANRRSFYRLTQIDDISNGTNREKRANFDSIGRKHLS